MSDLVQLLTTTLLSPDFVHASLGGPRRGGPESAWRRVRVRRLGSRIQFEYLSDTQAFTRHPDDVPAAIRELADLRFSAVEIATKAARIAIRLSKKGRISVRKQPHSGHTHQKHNRVKDVPLPENKPIPLFALLSLTDASGRIRASKRAKFTQINEFLKHFLHVLDDSGLRRLNRPIEILDAGCGLSFLTFALHYYLTEQLGLAARLLGVDVNAEVIRKSTERAAIAGSDTLKFVCDRIDAVTTTPDVVIALHACDTATDAALAAAIRAQAKLILCAPCCHHALNAQLKAANAEVLRPILRHGILHERQADLITDGFRALLLRIHGYRAEVVEFVSPEHTARNLLIRAVRTAKPEARYLQEYEAMKRFFGVTPHLESLLGPISTSK